MSLKIKERGKSMKNEEMYENCSKCNKKIPTNEYVSNGGLCKECMKEKEDYNFSYSIDYKAKSKIAKFIKIIAVLEIIVGFLSGLIFIENLGGVIACIIIGTCVISGIFIYALGEIIQLLQDIANNTKK